MPMARLWLALSAALRSLQGPPAFALTNWLWLRRAGWHDASPPFPHPSRPSPSVLTGPCWVSECWYKTSDPKTVGKYKADNFPSCFDLLLEKRKKKIMVSFSEYSNLDQKSVGQITKGSVFCCCVFCEKQEFKLELNKFMKLLDYSYGLATAKTTDPLWPTGGKVCSPLI